MARRKKRLAGLGAVDGEKVEYFLPAAIFNASASNAKKSIAYCMRDVEAGLLGYLEYQSAVSLRKAERELRRAELHRELDVKSQQAVDELAARGERVVPPTGKSALLAARRAGSKAKAGDIFKQTADEIRKDIAEIRAKGITGPIPACVYRTSGKYGDKALKSAEAKATRDHERFHADVSRAEYRANQVPHGCELQMAKLLGNDLDPELRGFSADYWTNRGVAPVEEILARVEEVNKACYSSEQSHEACNSVGSRINDWFIGKRRPELAASFSRVVAAVGNRFGTPLDVAKKACSVPAGTLRGLSKKTRSH